MLHALIVQTLRAIAAALLSDLNIPSASHDAIETVTAYLCARLEELRFPFNVGLAGMTFIFRLETWLRYHRSIDRLPSKQCAELLHRWLASPIRLRSDAARALTAYGLIAALDHPTLWTAANLEHRDAYQRLVQLYHGFSYDA